jgi:hypothetical protein
MAKFAIALQMLRERFTLALEEAFAERFEGREVTTQWNIIHQCYVTTPDDCEAFTEDQRAFIGGFETAWLKATAVVQEEADA